MDTELEQQVININKWLPSNPIAVCDEETDGLLFALAHAVEQRDRQTAGHCERLACIAVAIGMALRLSSDSLQALYRGGFLHDVGKVGIPDSILFKPVGLTAEEWIIMRSHSARGEEICCHLKSLAPVLPIIRHHHERWDGSGYPDGLRNQQIPLLARVLQVADIYDALTSLRPYKAAYPADEALKIIEEETSRGWCDPEVVRMFLRVHKSVIAKIGHYNNGADCNLATLQNSFTDFHALMDAVALRTSLNTAPPPPAFAVPAPG
jgi:putative two-component system response regulator